MIIPTEEFVVEPDLTDPANVAAGRQIVLQYGKTGDLRGATEALEQIGWDRTAASRMLRASDLAARKGVTLMSFALFGIALLIWFVLSDFKLFAIAPAAWGAERWYRAVVLNKRAKEQ